MEAQRHDVLYYENIEGGHGGAANNKEEAYQSALAYTFLWKKLLVGAGATASKNGAGSASKNASKSGTAPMGAVPVNAATKVKNK